MTATTMTIQGRSYPIQGYVRCRSFRKPIPLLGIRMMSDERERELARKGAAV